MAENETKIESFYKKYLGSNKESFKISLEALGELKKEGITTEQFLDYLCQKHGLLLHGSIHEIKHNKIKSGYNKIFASNLGVIAIERSLYSNVGVNLQYPYCVCRKK